MKFKVGDRVRFLNERGGGVISKIISHALVNVAIEDGFEIPTMVSNLILVEESAPSPVVPPQPGPRVIEAPAEAQPPERFSPLLSRSGQKKPGAGLYLAFQPENQRWLLTGYMDIFLLNQTPFDVMFNLLLPLSDGGFHGKEFDIIPRQHRYHLARVKADHLRKWGKGTLQFLFRRKKLIQVLMPASVNFKISDQRFHAESNYMENALMEGRHFLISLMPMPQHAEMEDALEGRTPEPPVIEAKPELPVEIIEAYRTREDEAVVDLHIESLTDVFDEMKNHEILALQKATFKACLESALRLGYRRVTFIHGIGAGRLKQEIITLLDAYREIRVQDAPMNEFGQGALEIILPQP